MVAIQASRYDMTWLLQTCSLVVVKKLAGGSSHCWPVKAAWMRAPFTPHASLLTITWKNSTHTKEGGPCLLLCPSSVPPAASIGKVSTCSSWQGKLSTGSILSITKQGKGGWVWSWETVILIIGTADNFQICIFYLDLFSKLQTSACPYIDITKTPGVQHVFFIIHMQIDVKTCKCYLNNASGVHPFLWIHNSLDMFYHYHYRSSDSHFLLVLVPCSQFHKHLSYPLTPEFTV